MAQAQYTNIGGAESLWVDHTVQRNVSATNTTCNAVTGGNASVRWYQANVTGGNVAANVVQGQTFDPEAANTFFRFMPSLAVDRVGDLAIGYTKSNATTNPQIKYAGRLASDPLNQLPQTYFTFKPNMLSPPGGSGTVTATTDPFGNTYGYSTIQAATQDSTKGYNPTFDLWSTTGLTTDPPPTNDTITPQWIKNW